MLAKTLRQISHLIGPLSLILGVPPRPHAFILGGVLKGIAKRIQEEKEESHTDAPRKHGHKDVNDLQVPELRVSKLIFKL